MSYHFNYLIFEIHVKAGPFIVPLSFSLLHNGGLDKI
jgi:hypothetical protein